MSSIIQVQRHNLNNDLQSLSPTVIRLFMSDPTEGRKIRGGYGKTTVHGKGKNGGYMHTDWPDPQMKYIGSRSRNKCRKSSIYTSFDSSDPTPLCEPEGNPATFGPSSARLASISSRSLRVCFPSNPNIRTDTTHMMAPWKTKALCMLRGGFASDPALKADSADGMLCQQSWRRKPLRRERGTYLGS